MADKETLRICDIVFQMSDEGAACGIQFSDEFMAQDEELQGAMIDAMQTTVNNFVERSGMVMKDDDIEMATQDAANFLDSCVKKQGGKI
tara:strand:+ start:335 stop:601 length:267 start_codon:yes stop_codon:yes gene_type:complete